MGVGLIPVDVIPIEKQGVIIVIIRLLARLFHIKKFGLHAKSKITFDGGALDIRHFPRELTIRYEVKPLAVWKGKNPELR